MKPLFFVAVLLLISSCQLALNESSNQSSLRLPQAISNNAVAKASIINNEGQETWFYSFNGLKKGKSWQDVSSVAFAVNPKSGESIQIPNVPGNSGRLASIAATVNNKIYIFGGYTVAEDHSEVSTPEVYRFNPQTKAYELVTMMPVPVDDSVALVYQNRYIYLVSGWHNDGNVSLVQVLDTHDMSWHQATPYPGAPVFGHAAGIVGNQMVISDGVKVLKVVDGKRHYGISDDNYLGTIDKTDFRQINWQKLPIHPGPARYRMATAGSERLNQIIFVGGSENPYNFNGIGYNGIPSEPSGLIFAYDLSNNQWQTLGKQKPATMDHRGLLEFEDDFYILGGMLERQETTPEIFAIKW
ncbi:MAG: galactose oxidase [Gammaproteobacteria bacterium]|nr:galactose oxidase [Gammaproteobacteria bacterium]